LLSGRQHRVAVDGEVRLFPFEDPAKLFLLGHGQVSRSFGNGSALGYSVGLAAIWTIGDKLYLDGDVTFSKTTCLAQPCTSTATLAPRVLLTFNL